MKNKFDALKAFQSWPREWQQLCAQFCWENDLPDAPNISSEYIDQVQNNFGPRPVRRAAAKRPLHFMRYTRDELEEIDSWLSSGCRPLETARRMSEKHPLQRTVEAWEKMVHRVKKHGLQNMLKNAIDLEIK